MRFLKGLVLSAIGLIACIYHNDIIKWAESTFQGLGYTSDEAFNAAGLAMLVPILIAVCMFFLGIYVMMTHNSGPLPIFTSREAGPMGAMDGQSSKYNGLGNLKSTLDYRDATMGTVGNKEGTEMFAKTAWVDGVIANNGGNENTQFTINYLNAKLGTMGNKEGLDWLKSGAK